MMIQEHYTVQGNLTSLNVEVKESPSLLEFRGTADLSEEGGRSFHVIIDYNAYQSQLAHIIRKRPAP